MVLADRLHKLPAEIRGMDMDEFLAMSAYTRIAARREREALES